MQIQISWLFQKPSDLDLHCLQSQGISGFSRTRVYCIYEGHICHKAEAYNFANGSDPQNDIQEESAISLASLL